MLNTISYTTWRRLVRPRGAAPSAPPDPVWVLRDTYTRAVSPQILREFIRIVQRQQVHADVHDSANL